MKSKSYSRILALLMSCIMMTAICSTPVFAYDKYEEEIVIEEYALANSTCCSLEIVNNVAYLSSGVEGKTSVTKVTATQTLEKFVALWIWEPVSGASWTKTENDRTLDIDNQKSLSQTGTYRAKTVFKLTSSNGSTEEITVYSNEVKI